MMSTTKKRINITIDDEEYEALEEIAHQRKKSVSSIGYLLIQRALELEEDLYFSKIADERLARKEKTIPHSKVWKK